MGLVRFYFFFALSFIFDFHHENKQIISFVSHRECVFGFRTVRVLLRINEKRKRFQFSFCVRARPPSLVFRLFIYFFFFPLQHDGYSVCLFETF